MDGENTTIHCEGTHARSVDSRSHPSRDWLKQFAASVSPQLDPCERICGEYLYAKHSIAYNDLQSYFLGFGWFIEDELQSWEDTVQRFEQLGICSVPVLYYGPYHDGIIEETINGLDMEVQEGFVMRSASAFTVEEFSVRVGKFVRENHVQTDTHWMNAEIVKNGLTSTT